MAKIVGVEGMTGADLQRELAQGGKFVIFQYCISIVILTFRRSSAIYLVRAGENAVVKGLPYTLLTLIVGWWGIPWGPIYSVASLATNLRGGKDVTREVLDSVTRSAAQMSA